MSRHLWLILVGVGVVGAVGAGFVRLRASRQEASDGTSRMRALEARLALLEKQRRRTDPASTSAPSERAHLLVPATPSETVTSDPTTVQGKSRAPTARADEVALQQEYFGDLDVRLASETRDPVWSASTEEKLRGSVQDLQPRITVDNAQCARTICRVETTVPDPREDGIALNKFISASLALLPEAVIREGDGPGRHIVYFARQGAGFPPMNAPETSAQ
jgi:hypothetical protein